LVRDVNDILDARRREAATYYTHGVEERNMVIISKKGNKNDVKNSRQIYLLPNVYKLLTKG